MIHKTARALLVSLGLLLSAADRERPTDYPVHAQCGGASLGAEFLSRSLLSPEGNVLLRDYVAVEVGFLTPKRGQVLLSSGHFTLRINGKKQVLMSQAPAMVAAAVKYEDWERRPTLVGSAGMGGADVILGRPRQTERFPGDRRPADSRLPAPPRAPDQQDRSGVEMPERRAPEEIVERQALPEGEIGGFVKGMLYFPFKAKTSTIQKLELIYEGPCGQAVLKLQP